jgi:hypothetical protein
MEKYDRARAALGRREFLRGAGLGAVGIAAGAAISSIEPAAAEGAKPAHAGYRESEHVQKYYAAAKRF